MIVRVSYAGRHVTVKVPDGVSEVEVEIPPAGSNGNGESKKPLIILTDK
jgi:hypothetical protein